MDRPAFDQTIKTIYEKYLTKIIGYMVVKYGIHDEIGDVIQDVVVTLLKERYWQLDNEQEIVKYLWKSVENRCLNVLRNRRKYVYNMIAETEEHVGDYKAGRLEGIGRSIKELIEKKLELKEILHKVRNGLGKKIYAVGIMRFLQEYTMDEIVEETGLSVSTIGRYSTKFVKRFHKYYENKDL